MNEHKCESIPCPFCDLRPAEPPSVNPSRMPLEEFLAMPVVVEHPDGTTMEHYGEILERDDAGPQEADQ